MDNVRSKYNPLLTLDYMTTNDEKKFFDRKSAQIKRLRKNQAKFRLKNLFS